MAAELLIQLAAAFFGTLCFALLFHVPHRHLWCCGIAGMTGWLFYWSMMQAQQSPVAASLVAVIPLAVLTRVFAVARKAPVRSRLSTHGRRKGYSPYIYSYDEAFLARIVASGRSE